MARKRDYKAEYQRRIERGLKRGLSRSQARGHPAKSEPTVSGKTPPKVSPELDRALKALRRGSTQKAAAESAGVSVERFRRFIYGNDLARRDGSQWTITDDRPRRVKVIVGGQSKAVTVSSFTDAQKAGEYSNAVKDFLRTNDLTWLEPFDGDGVTDMRGRFVPFETDPNALYRHAAADEPAFHEVYQIVST